MLWKYIRMKFAKLGCFISIAIMGAVIGLLTKLVLSWSGSDSATASEVASTSAKAMFVTVLLIGVCSIIHEQWTKRRGRHIKPPPLPGSRPPAKPVATSQKPPPLPGNPRSRKAKPYEDDYNQGSRYQR